MTWIITQKTQVNFYREKTKKGEGLFGRTSGEDRKLTVEYYNHQHNCIDLWNETCGYTVKGTETDFHRLYEQVHTAKESKLQNQGDHNDNDNSYYYKRCVTNSNKYIEDFYEIVGQGNKNDIIKEHSMVRRHQEELNEEKCAVYFQYNSTDRAFEDDWNYDRKLLSELHFDQLKLEDGMVTVGDLQRKYKVENLQNDNSHYYDDNYQAGEKQLSMYDDYPKKQKQLITDNEHDDFEDVNFQLDSEKQRQRHMSYPEENHSEVGMDLPMATEQQSNYNTSQIHHKQDQCESNRNHLQQKREVDIMREKNRQQEYELEEEENHNKDYKSNIDYMGKLKGNHQKDPKQMKHSIKDLNSVFNNIHQENQDYEDEYKDLIEERENLRRDNQLLQAQYNKNMIYNEKTEFDSKRLEKSIQDLKNEEYELTIIQENIVREGLDKDRMIKQKLDERDGIMNFMSEKKPRKEFYKQGTLQENFNAEDSLRRQITKYQKNLPSTNIVRFDDRFYHEIRRVKKEEVLRYKVGALSNQTKVVEDKYVEVGLKWSSPVYTQNYQQLTRFGFCIFIRNKSRQYKISDLSLRIPENLTQYVRNNKDTIKGLSLSYNEMKSTNLDIFAKWNYEKSATQEMTYTM